MKTYRKSLLFLLLLALGMPWAAKAQNETTVTIGEDNSATFYPLPGLYRYQYDVYLYKPSAAEALNADCDFSSIAFYVSSNNTSGKSSMEIWVKDVDANYSLGHTSTFGNYINGAT